MSTLYITTQGANLQKRSGQFLILKNGKILQNVPETHIKQIILCGNVNLTTPTIAFCLDKKIEVVFLSQGGKFRGRLNGDGSRSIEVRRKQFEMALDKQFCLKQAQAFVSGKIQNQIAIIKRQYRNKPNPNELNSMCSILQKIENAKSTESLLGLEGSASAIYFRLFGTFIPEPFKFARRTSNPPKDEVNAILSLSYTLLYNRIVTNLNLIGLDPYQGFFHKVKNGHAALASDLLEEFRPVIADTLVLKLIRRKQLRPDNFEKKGNKVLLSAEAQKIYFAEFEAQMNSKRKVKLQNDWNLSFSEIIKRQNYHFARVITGEEPIYQPFLAK